MRNIHCVNPLVDYRLILTEEALQARLGIFMHLQAVLEHNQGTKHALTMALNRAVRPELLEINIERSRQSPILFVLDHGLGMFGDYVNHVVANGGIPDTHPEWIRNGYNRTRGYVTGDYTMPLFSPLVLAASRRLKDEIGYDLRVSRDQLVAAGVPMHGDALDGRPYLFSPELVTDMRDYAHTNSLQEWAIPYHSMNRAMDNNSSIYSGVGSLLVSLSVSDVPFIHTWKRGSREQLVRQTFAESSLTVQDRWGEFGSAIATNAALQRGIRAAFNTNGDPRGVGRLDRPEFNRAISRFRLSHLLDVDLGASSFDAFKNITI